MATIRIDGSCGEGGGQIIRNASAFASILGKNIKIVNIRAGRKTPGLRPQHLVGLRLLAAASGASLSQGNFVGSTEIVFLANSANAVSNDDKREYVGDTQTAGSICLLMQTVLPFALFRGIVRNTNFSTRNIDENKEKSLLQFVLKGGTDTDFAPSVDYFQHVFLPIFNNSFDLAPTESCEKGDKDGTMKTQIDLSVIRRGFFPRGGGEVHATIHRPILKKFPLPPIRLTKRGEIVGITIRAFSAGNCPLSMARALSSTAEATLSSTPSCREVPISIELFDESLSTLPLMSIDRTEGNRSNGERRGTKRRRHLSSGCGILIIAETNTGCLLAGSSIGSPKIPLEETSKLAAQQVIDAIEGGGCVDNFLQDQLILYMALAEGVSELVTSCLTLHTRTSIWLASLMLPSVRFQVTQLEASDDQGERRRPDENENILNRNVAGTIPGGHLIRCWGIGFCPEDKS
ncbi:unnamed protein product [Pseudo-nitzschia multistriata]|uniref:Uncharacterized protein n=1 Tax=Pseudo-nitzschia multistriata TaxID=183589 RepID=A0A448YUE2_9STRA|nr:unnamed protein product [Pseudo-nitzschia multistriata]